MARPSSTTRPAVGFSRRLSTRSRVDLPHALGPTIAVNDPAGTTRFNSVPTGWFGYP